MRCALAAKALRKLFAGAGGLPKATQRGFGPQAAGGKAEALLRQRGASTKAAPPSRKAKNALAEREWQPAAEAARARRS